MCYKTYFFDHEESFTLKTARFVIKLVYPKFNSYIFFIYLWIRYVIQLERNKIYRKVNMSGFAVKTIPKELHEKLVQEYFDKPTSCDNFYGPHIIIVPKAHFDLLYSENFYYRDGKTLWMSMVLASFKDLKKESEIKNDFENIKRFLKYENKSVNSTTNSKRMPKTSLFINSELGESIFTERIVQIIPCNTSSEEEVYVTEDELFNVKHNMVSKHFHLKCRIKFNPIQSTNVAPKIAKSISVQMVTTSSNIGTDLVDTMLTHYFKYPRFLHDNDYFTVPLEEKYMGPLFLKYYDIVGSVQRLYFKCTKIFSETASNSTNNGPFVNIGCFVVRGETDMLQDQNFNSYIPSMRYFQLNVEKTVPKTIDINKYKIENCPYGLDTYFTALKKAIQPFLLDKQVSPLHTELKCVLHPVFLLRGDLGAGCHLLITRLSQNLGLHFFATSCRSFIASTAKQTEARLEAMFQKAKTTAPVLIHLQDFNTFGVDAENNEDSRIVESFVQKLKDLYDNFTKFPIIIIASCENSIELKPNILRIFLEIFMIKSPNRTDRFEMLKWLILTKNVSFLNENFEPLLSTDESLIYLMSEENNKQHTQKMNVDNFELKSHSHNEDEKSLSSITTETIKPNEFNEMRKKKNKDSTGKKTKNKSSKCLSNIDSTDKTISDERKSAELAVEMVSLERRLLHTPITEDTILTKDKRIEIKEPNTISEAKNASIKKPVDYVVRRLGVNRKISTFLEKLSSKTETFLYGDLDMLTNLALKNAYIAYHNVNRQKSNNTSVHFNMGMVREMDFENALESLRLMQSKKLGSLKIPNVEWEDIGGLEDLKKEISRTIELPLKFPHLLANSSLRRSGLLLWGPPGCGKTLVARAVASQLKAAFLSVKGPELLDMYVGQSERNMRDMFAAARACAPCVIFLDEAEAAAGSRGASGDAGGAADRLVSQLLAELDGVAALQTDTQTGPVIVIAATNRPDLVEPALLRPGRLDRLLYVGPYEGEVNKNRVLVAACRGYNIEENVKLNDVSNKLPEKCTGADLSAIVNTARKYALARAVHSAELGEIEPSKLSEEHIVISSQDFERAVVTFVPSISESEMNYYESLKSKLS